MSSRTPNCSEPETPGTRNCQNLRMATAVLSLFLLMNKSHPALRPREVSIICGMSSRRKSRALADAIEQNLKT
jgi:hypothetical protein